MKSFTFCFLIIGCFSIGLKAQTTQKDSLIKIAKTDVRKLFWLKRPELTTFRRYRYTSSSDFFKPNELNVSNPMLLKDLVYVNAYRINAYNSTKKRRTTGHYFLIGGISFVGAVVALTVGLMAGAAK